MLAAGATPRASTFSSHRRHRRHRPAVRGAPNIDRPGIDRSREAAQQLGVKANEYYDSGRAKAGELYNTARDTAGEYYEATRERAAELYDTATTKAGEVASVARDTAARQAGSVQAAFEAGKKAYVEEKRKTELSGRTEAAPTYKPEKTM